MEQKPNAFARKKFFIWGLGIFSSVSLLKWILPAKKKSNSVKMLSEDGQLVEVDMDKIHKTGIKISDKEVITWVKNKPTF